MYECLVTNYSINKYMYRQRPLQKPINCTFMFVHVEEQTQHTVHVCTYVQTNILFMFSLLTCCAKKVVIPIIFICWVRYVLIWEVGVCFVWRVWEMWIPHWHWILKWKGESWGKSNNTYLVFWLSNFLGVGTGRCFIIVGYL